MDLNLAVLIDGDNIPSAYVKEMMEEIAKYGNPTIKRIYGDWTKPNLSKWKNLLLENAITPIQQYGSRSYWWSHFEPEPYFDQPLHKPEPQQQQQGWHRYYSN